MTLDTNSTLNSLNRIISLNNYPCPKIEDKLDYKSQLNIYSCVLAHILFKSNCWSVFLSLHVIHLLKIGIYYYYFQYLAPTLQLSTIGSSVCCRSSSRGWIHPPQFQGINSSFWSDVLYLRYFLRVITQIAECESFFQYMASKQFSTKRKIIK